MVHSRPQPTDPLTALTLTSATTEAHSRWHGRTNSIWENVKAHGAVGDGSNDDTSAVQAAIDALGSSRGTVFFPPGQYKVTSSLSVGTTGTTTIGVKFVGAGTRATRIEPSAAFASDPVILFTNARHCHVEDMSIRGNASTSPESGIEFHVNNPGTEAPTACVVRNVTFGAVAAGDGSNMVDGIRVTANASYDQNNDFHRFDNCRMNALSGAAYSLEHKNTLCNTIIGGLIGSCAKGVVVRGGSFSMVGAGMANITTTEFDFQAPASSVYTHPSSIVGVQTEYSDGSGATIVDTTADAGIDVFITNYERYGSKATLAVIDYDSDGNFVMTNSKTNMGQAAQTATFAAGSDARFIGCDLQLHTITYSGTLTLLGNTYISNPTLTPSGASARLDRIDAGGGAALATDATTGFSYVPTCAGTPTGTPVAKTGYAPMVFDTSNNKLYVYDGGWVDVT